MSKTEELPEKRAKTSGSATDGSVPCAIVNADGTGINTSARSDYISTSRVNVRAHGGERIMDQRKGASASSASVAKHSASTAGVIEVKKERLVKLVVVVLLVIVVDILLTQASVPYFMGRLSGPADPRIWNPNYFFRVVFPF